MFRLRRTQVQSSHSCLSNRLGHNPQAEKKISYLEFSSQDRCSIFENNLARYNKGTNDMTCENFIQSQSNSLGNINLVLCVYVANPTTQHTQSSHCNASNEILILKSPGRSQNVFNFNTRTYVTVRSAVFQTRPCGTLVQLPAQV